MTREPRGANLGETIPRLGAKLASRVASPTIAGVALHDTDLIYGDYKEWMLRAQNKRRDFFKKRISGEA